MSKNYIINFSSRIFIICLLCFIGATQVWAVHVQDYYEYKTHVSVNPTGKGTVYVNYSASTRDNSSNTTNSIRGKDYNETVSAGGNTTTVTLNATPIDGWRFLRWEDGGGNTLEGGTSPTVTLTHDMTSKQENEYWGGLFWNYTYKQDKVYNFTAYFAENGTVIAKVKKGQESIGSAVIKEQSFKVGDKVHLEANNINDSQIFGWFFDHWEREDEVAVENAERNIIEVEVTDDRVTYIAVFNQVDTENYCFFRNKGTGQYLKIVATNNYINPTDQDNPIGSLNGSFAMVEETKAISDPGCVFMVTGSTAGGGLQNLKQVTIISQGQAVGGLKGAKIISKPLTISSASASTYYISFTGTVKTKNGNVDVTLYFRDNKGTPDLPSTTTDESSQWEMLMLNKANLETNYFGLSPNALLKKGNKYYTTLYTTFPYELQSGKAYYINDESIKPYGEEGKYRVACHEVAGKQVPANSAVIIECDGTSPADNKILPLPQSTHISPFEGQHQLLHGYTKIEHGEKSGNGHIYVLSVGQKTGLGFYKLKSGTPMADNKAYSSLSEEAQSAAKSISFSFGDDDMETPLAIEEVALPENIVGQPIYDLQGRRVKNPSQGIYIVNGKKYVIK